METLKKLQEARKRIKEAPIKKQGHNSYSKYDYFTPEQISGMVSKVNQELNLFHKFDLIRGEYGLNARLTIYDLDSNDRVFFDMVTEIPEIKATNVAQQLGGCVTYSERYLMQIAYDIKDNNLDFDAGNTQKKAQPEKTELTPDHEMWSKAVEHLKTPKGKINDITGRYKVSPENIEKLKESAL